MSNLTEKAKIFAKQKHANQQRKYTGEPYFVHCNEVAEIVKSVGGTDEMIAAAYLHDTVEDCNVSIDIITEMFGEEVSELVGWLTDVSKPSDGNRQARKEIDRKHTAMASPEAKTIKLADLISNSKSIAKHDKDFARVYLKEKRLLLDFLTEGNPTLLEQAKKVLIEAENEL